MRCFQGLKIALIPVLGLFGLLVVFIFSGKLGLLPSSLKDEFEATFTFIDSIQGPAGFVISILAALFGLYKFVRKDQELDAFNCATVRVLFDGYMKNFLKPVRGIAEKDGHPVVIAAPGYSLLQEPDYVRLVLDVFKAEGFSVKEVPGIRPRSYFLVSRKIGKANCAVIFDIPTTLVTLTEIIDVNLKTRGEEKTAVKAKKLFNERRQDFFDCLEAWTEEEDCRAVFSHIQGEDEGGFRGLAETFAKHFKTLF